MSESKAARKKELRAQVSTAVTMLIAYVEEFKTCDLETMKHFINDELKRRSAQ